MDDRQKLVKILAIELQDLIGDMQTLEALVHLRVSEGKTTNYVAQANLGLLQTETDAIQALVRWLKAIKPLEYDSISALRDAIDQEFLRMTSTHDFPESIYALIKRKLNKLSHYIWDQTVS